MSNNLREAGIPLTILTGFLGAGKTTLLNRIISGDHGLRVAVLVNDFGSVNIDAQLVVGVEDNMVSLANGCVCCQIRDDLVQSVEDLIDRPERVEYILLEASGVADPHGISTTFVDDKLRDRVRLDSVTCVVDAEQVFDYQEFAALNLLKLKQIGYADMVVLNKVDLAGKDKTQKVRDWIDEQFNRVRVVEANYCNVPLEVLLSVGRFDSSQLLLELDNSVVAIDEMQDSTQHAKHFETFTYETSDPISLDALRRLVKRHLPNSVYRCKGVIFAKERPDMRGTLQCVGRRADITFADEWGESLPKTQIVAIAAPGKLSEYGVRDLFDAVRSEAVE